MSWTSRQNIQDLPRRLIVFKSAPTGYHEGQAFLFRAAVRVATIEHLEFSAIYFLRISARSLGTPYSDKPTARCGDAPERVSHYIRTKREFM
jgi:hypothetical protein